MEGRAQDPQGPGEEARTEGAGPVPVKAFGLCASCRHARVQRGARGNAFLRCGLAESDARFTRYPRVPVRACPGFQASRGGC
jgi:hypothetical protein